MAGRRPQRSEPRLRHLADDMRAKFLQPDLCGFVRMAVGGAMRLMKRCTDPRGIAAGKPCTIERYAHVVALAIVSHLGRDLGARA